jgi:LmbE family N-acetylglucosaminyl deacetylase
MVPLLFDDVSLRGRPTVLALGSHSDDIELGAGGTLLHLAERYPGLNVVWVVLSATAERAAEARESADVFLDGTASRRVIVEDFHDGFFPYEGGAIKEFFEWLKSQVEPDIVLTHRRADSHQDHRFVCELTWSTFRDNMILEYEIPKYDGELSSPNLYLPISREVAERKVRTILRCFETQRSRHWFTEDLFMAMLRLRGMEANSPTQLAEAFTCRKLTLDVAATEARAQNSPMRDSSGRDSSGRNQRPVHLVSGERDDLTA